MEETLDAGRFQKFMLKWGICLIYILEPLCPLVVVGLCGAAKGVRLGFH